MNGEQTEGSKMTFLPSLTKDLNK